MKLCIMLVWVLMPLVSTKLHPPRAKHSYKILMLLPVSSKSHRNVFMAVASALIDRGHQITMLTNHQHHLTKNSNIHEVTHGLHDFTEDTMNFMATRNNPTVGFPLFMQALPAIARKMYHVPQVWQLYTRRKEFDLIIISNMFNEVAYPFLYEMPFITLAIAGMDYRQSAIMGNLLPTSYAANMRTEYPHPLTYPQRIFNTISSAAYAFFWRQWAVVPLVQNEITQQFPELPPILDLERNMSLTLINSHYSVETVYPLLPNQIQVGGMHCQPGHTLSKDLSHWVDSAEEGVIYFSLGSIMRGDSMPSRYRDIFLQAFAKISQRVIWKYEGVLRNIPPNVLMRKWLPQQDILAHPNVKVFISHCGLLSVYEAVYHATPVLAIPIAADHMKAGTKIQNEGFGLTLIWEKLTVDLIVNSLNDLINNSRYADNIATASATLRDQKETPRDRVVFWTEYVIRHRGAPLLHCPGADLPWVEFLCLDLLLFTHIFFIAVCWFLKRKLGRLCRRTLRAKPK